MSRPAAPPETRWMPASGRPRMDELTVGIERLLMPTLTVGLKGTYRSLNSTLEDRCDFDYTSPETNYSSCALINPGSSGKFASGDVPTCNGLCDDPEWYQCYPRGPASPEVKRILPRHRALRAPDGRQLSLAPGELRLLVAARQLRRRRQPGRLRPDLARASTATSTIPELWHNGYGTLALDRPNRFRFDGYWVTPWRLSVGLQAFVEIGRAAQPDGLLQRRLRDLSSFSFRAARSGACRHSGGRTSPSPTRSRSVRRP